MDPEQSFSMARVTLNQASEYGQLPMDPEQSLIMARVTLNQASEYGQ